MSDDKPPARANTQILVKLRSSAAALQAGARSNLRPLRVTIPGSAPAFGIDTEPQWFIADLPNDAANPWDLAHTRVADQLGVADGDVMFAEPDLVHGTFPDDGDVAPGSTVVVGKNCEPLGQNAENGQAVGPDKVAWHLDDEFSQLGSARDAVQFSERRTRIAHLDTGYYAAHATLPQHVNHLLEANFVDGFSKQTNAEDPDNKRFLLDNSGHGTGTLGILAGGTFPAANGMRIGGAPDAEVVPLRIADTVVLLKTSAFASALDYAVQIQCDVATMSMGGLPSRAWRESIDRAYLAGLCLVAAAGNNFNGMPTRHLVYPARFSRVIAACGVMANGQPYAGFKGLKTMEGNFGPDSVMKAAISAYTPNIPWARYGCTDAVRLNGGGTSSATPQVAATVALWFEKYKNELPRDWRRIEAVRNALFTTAKLTDNRSRLGHGVIQANAALAVRPVLGLPQTKSDNDSFAFLRVITGLGLAEAPPREQMLNLELMQRWLLNTTLQGLVADPEGAERVDDATMVKIMEAVIDDEGASLALRKHVASRYPIVTGQSVPPTPVRKPIVPDVLPACDSEPAIRDPVYRRLRVYAVDPSFATRLDTADINEATLNVRWESLSKGPVGEYLEVTDADPSGKTYTPVNLDDARLLAQDGWSPSEGNAQFHQQMVYAVAMTTIEHFERALGRPVLWRHGTNPKDRFDDSIFTPRLRVQPHALRQANAFYSPEKIALLFGYFEASANQPGDHMPGSRIYSCLSHDIVAHETTHAVLDGMYRRFNEPTNVDVLALHEGFADIVALLQHFTMREVLRTEIARTRGDLESESMLGSLAVQFGQASGGRSALRDAIGHMENGVWKRFIPDPADLEKRVTPHERGALLVGAVFDAFLAIYKTRTADLLRLYTGGTGVLPSGAVHPDLVNRLADEASKSASHVLTMCVRALDYLPPVDVTFFEYLRAIITADFDMVRDDRLNYRVAFVESFRRRGIYPLNIGVPSQNTLRTLSVDTLRWQGLDTSAIPQAVQQQYYEIVQGLKRYADACLYMKNRQQLFRETWKRRLKLHTQLARTFEVVPDFAKELGLDAGRSFEVHELRRAARATPDGKQVTQLIVALTQSEEVLKDNEDTPTFTFRGGSTLVIDLTVPEVKYRIVKNMDSESRRARTEAFVREVAADPVRSLFLAPNRPEPFAALHAIADTDGY